MVQYETEPGKIGEEGAYWCFNRLNGLFLPIRAGSFSLLSFFSVSSVISVAFSDLKRLCHGAHTDFGELSRVETNAEKAERRESNNNGPTSAFFILTSSFSLLPLPSQFMTRRRS